MLDTLVQLLDGSNFSKILFFLIAYIVVLWFVFCIWVLFDARKRYKKFFLPILFFIIVLIFNFPALVFYLIVRPEIDEENVFYLHGGSEEISGGVNVPIVNFIGEDGNVEMTINLKFAKPTQKISDMRINVGWESEKAEFIEGQKEEGRRIKELDENEKSENEKEDKADSTKRQPLKNIKASLSLKAKGLASKTKGLASKFKLPKRSSKKMEEKVEETEKSPEDVSIEEKVEEAEKSAEATPVEIEEKIEDLEEIKEVE